MLGKLALIGTLGLCTAFGWQHPAQDPQSPGGQAPERRNQEPQDPERVIEELERRLESMAEAFEERFEQQIEVLEEELEQQLEAAAEELERRIEGLEKEFEERIEALEERFERQFEERFEERIEELEEEFEEAWEENEDEDRNCTPSRALITRFDRARQRGDLARAARAVDRIVQRHGSDLNSLNSLAWELLTGDGHAGAHDELALALAQRMVDHEGRMTHYMKDTVALALFRNGMVEQAVDLQRQAIAEGGRDGEYRRRLATYEKALEERVAKRFH